MKGWARWVGLALLTTVALAGCGSNNSSTAVTLTVSPGSATVLLNTSVQFVPTAAGSTNAVDWSVNGILGGNATVGTIDVSGLYTAPSTLPSTGSGVVAQVISVVNNSAIPGSGATGAVIQFRPGSDFSQFVAGNQITVAGNSVASWNSTFPISFAATLSNGNYAVQIPFQGGSPANGTGGTATIAVGITITAQIENTSAVANATVTLDSGIRVSISPSSFTIGTNETFNFFPTYAVSGTSNQTVIWNVTGVGSIDPNSGLYTAPGATGTATVTATSSADTAQFASASVTIVTAMDPTITSITPPSRGVRRYFSAGLRLRVQLHLHDQRAGESQSHSHRDRLTILEHSPRRGSGFDLIDSAHGACYDCAAHFYRRAPGRRRTGLFFAVSTHSLRGTTGVGSGHARQYSSHRR